jgi:predicted dehydrogenase
MAKRQLNVAMIGYGSMGRAHSNAWRQVARFFPDGPCEAPLANDVAEVERMAAAAKRAGVVNLFRTFITARPLPDDSGRHVKVDVDDSAQALAKFANGAVGYYEGSRFAPGSKSHNCFEINGSKGSLAWNFERMNEPEVCLEAISKHPYLQAWWPPGHVIGHEHSFTHTVYDFSKAIAEGKSPRPGFEDGLKNQRVLDAIERSAAQGQWAEVA